MRCVYIYRSGERNVFKIGRATDLARRLKTHATGNPEPLTEFDVIETEHAVQCETYMHHRLRSKQYRRGEGKEWFEVDPDELAQVISDARHYLAEMLPAIAEAGLLSAQACEDRVLQPTDGVMETYRALVLVREKHDTLGFEKDYLEAQLKKIIGTATGIDRVADWKTIHSHRLDGDLLKQEQPHIFDTYYRETHYRRFDLL
jgi:predicted GIY-YIG superfamily endonuclease